MLQLYHKSLPQHLCICTANPMSCIICPMKTIIWDYNGTILDDAGISVEIENLMLKERGYPYGYSLEDYKNLYSMPMEEYYKELGYTFENETFEDASTQFMGLYEQYFERCTLCEGVMEKLKEAKEKDYRNVILSSCEDRILHEQCNSLGITSYFEEIMGVDNLVGGSKIGIGRDWMIRNDINPKDCLFLGDTSADYETAGALGIKNIVLISNGHQSFERLQKLHHKTVHSLKEVEL